MYFTFYSRKDGRKESVELLQMPTGWMMIHPCYEGMVEPNGMPHLQRCIEENYTEVPPALGDAFQEIWEAAALDRMTNGEMQERLDIFSEWVATYNVHKQLKPSYKLNAN
jgi:hypothetical protein